MNQANVVNQYILVSQMASVIQLQEVNREQLVTRNTKMHQEIVVTRVFECIVRAKLTIGSLVHREYYVTRSNLVSYKFAVIQKMKTYRIAVVTLKT